MTADGEEDEKYIGQDEDLFMLTYGDGVSDVDIRSWWSSTGVTGNWHGHTITPVLASE